MRVILADDAVMIREGLARLLADRGIDVVAQAGDADELLQHVAANRPDIAVIDIRMPPTYTTEGLVAAQTIRHHHPQVGTVVLSQYIEVDYALKLLTDGSERVGYLLKDRIADVNDFISALEAVADGGTIVEPTLVSELLDTSGRPPPARRAHPTRARRARPPRPRTDRSRHRRTALRQPQDRRSPRSQHPAQARPPHRCHREPAGPRGARLPPTQRHAQRRRFAPQRPTVSNRRRPACPCRRPT